MVERKGSVFGIITLIIGIAGLGLGGYSFYSNFKLITQGAGVGVFMDPQMEPIHTFQ